MSIQWIPLETPEQLQQILKESDEQTVVVYKHSTRCNVSRMVMDRLNRSAATFKDSKVYFLDVIADRNVSNLVADTFSVEHESPQLLLISGRQAILHLSHYDIEPGAIARRGQKLNSTF